MLLVYARTRRKTRQAPLFRWARDVKPSSQKGRRRPPNTFITTGTDAAVSSFITFFVGGLGRSFGDCCHVAPADRAEVRHGSPLILVSASRSLSACEIG